MHSSSGIVIFSLSEASAIKNGLPFGKPFLIAEENYFQACFMMFLYSLFR